MRFFFNTLRSISFKYFNTLRSISVFYWKIKKQCSAFSYAISLKSFASIRLKLNFNVFDQPEKKEIVKNDIMLLYVAIALAKKYTRFCLRNVLLNIYYSLMLKNSFPVSLLVIV